jgi:hypothetical protein
MMISPTISSTRQRAKTLVRKALLREAFQPPFAADMVRSERRARGCFAYHFCGTAGNAVKARGQCWK